MEIEAKWVGVNENIVYLHNWLDDMATYGGTIDGMTVSKRWNGTTKFYQDYYYDAGPNITPALDRGWVARHRTRWASSQSPAAWDPNAFYSVTTNGRWNSMEEEIIQVKDNPTRFSEVWFRHEWGNDCVLSGSGTRCQNTNYRHIFEVEFQDHPAMYQLYWGIDYAWPPYYPNWFVTDYRQRWLLKKNGVDTYEISLDWVVEWPWNCQYEGSVSCMGAASVRSEIELEIVKPNYTYDDLVGLFGTSDCIAYNASWAFAGPTIQSKGGVVVGDSAPY